jgi:excisionase family DNA binding protein
MTDILNKETRDWMTAGEVADYLKVEESTVKQWVKLKKIPHGRAGSLSRFDRKEIDEWVRGNGSEQEPAA